MKFIVNTLFLISILVAAFGATLYFLSGPSVDVDPNLPKFGTAPDSDAYIYPAIQLYKNGQGMCSAFVIDANYALTAAHCVDAGQKLDRTPLQVRDQDGNDLKMTVQPVGMNNRVDIGLIKGDFRKFKFYRVDFYGFTPTNAYGNYVTCGFPYLQKKLTCTNFKPTGNVGFWVSGTGFLIPGMSGGPVYDTVNDVIIGVNSAAGQGGILIAPTLGALGAFGIEP